MTSKERENFLRNAILVVDHSKAALVSLVELDVQKKGQTFEQFVNTNQHEIYHLYNRSRCCQCPQGHYPPRTSRILHQSQMELLFDLSSIKLPCHNTVRRSDDFCCSMARSGLCTDVLDLTLARCLLVHLCSDVFWFSCLQLQSITLEDFLNHNKHELYHLWQYNAPCCQCPPGYTFPTNHSVLYQNDWTQMFNTVLLPCTNHRKRSSPGSMQSICSVAAAHGRTLMNLDPSVSKIILQHICTLRMAVETLVQIRNQDYGHAKEGMMSDKDYNTSIIKIERCILEIAKVCNKETHFKQKLREAKDGALDQTLFTQYQNNLMETLTRQADIHQSVAEIGPCLNKIGKKIAEKAGKFPKLMDECVMKGYDYQEQLMERFNQTLVKVKNQTHMEIDCHVEEQTFVETNAVRKCKEWIYKKDVFVIIGNEGSGKSRNGLEILRQFGLIDEDFDLLKVTNIKQVKDIITDRRKTALLIDDGFSSKEYSNTRSNSYNILDLLNARKFKGNMKIVFTVDSTKINSFKYFLVSHRLFQNYSKIDLNSPSFCMSEDEKVKLLSNFCKKHKIDIAWYSYDGNEDFSLDGRTVYEIAKTDPFIGYPKVCFMFTSNKRFLRLGINFFTHPDQSLMTEINSLRDSTDTNLEMNISYALLVSTLLNTGCLEIDEIDISKLETIMESCGNCQRKRLFNCKIKKIAEQMEDHFLKQNTQTLVYHFKHPMIYEALAISYFEVNPSAVISVLKFDFIIDLIRLEKDDWGQKEISLIITKELFVYLTKRLFTIFEKDYKMRSAEFIKTLCSSSIILQNNPDFIGPLFKQFDNCTSQDTIDIHIEGRRDTMSFNFPRALLWFLIQKHNVDKPIATVLHFIENDMKDEQNMEKVKASKRVVVACFYYLCETDNSDMKLELIYGLIKEYGIECSYDYSIQIALKNGNDTAVSFLLCQVSKEIDIVKLVLEVEHVEDIRRLCELISTNLSIECIDTYNKTDILNILIRSFPQNFFNLRESINTACSKLCKNLVTGILSDARNLTFDTGNIVNTACENGWEDALKILLNKKLCNQSEKNQILTASCKDGMETFLKWMFLTVDTDELDVQQFVLHEFRCEHFETVQNFILKLQDHKEMEIMIKNLVTQFSLPILRFIQWVLEDTEKQIVTGNKNDLQSLYIVQWIYQRFPNLQTDVRNTVYKTINDTCDDSDEILQWLNENTKVIDHPVTSLLEFSCKNGLQKIVKWILQTFDHNTLNINEMIIAAYNAGYTKIAEVIIRKVDLNKVDVTSMITAMLSTCQSNSSKDLFLFLIQNFDQTYCRWMEIVTIIIDLELYNYIELILQHVDNSKIDMMKIVKNKMNVLSEKKLKELIQSIKQELLDINYIVWAAFKIGYHNIVAWSIINDDQNAFNKSELFDAAVFNGNTDVMRYLLENIDHKLLDIEEAVDIACRRGKFDIVEMLLLNVDDIAFDVKAAIDKVFSGITFDTVKTLSDNDNLLEINIDKVSECERIKVVKLMLKSFDHESFDLTTIINTAYEQRWFDLIKWVIEEVDDSLLDLNEILSMSCQLERLDIVILLAGKIVNSNADIGTVMRTVFIHGSFNFIKLLIANIDISLMDLGEAMNDACRDGKSELVRRLIESDNDMTDLNRLIKIACDRNWLDVIKSIGQAKGITILDLKTAMKEACRYQRMNIVRWLIQHNDNTMFGFKTGFEDACRDRHIDIIETLIQYVDHNLLGIDNVIYFACDSDNFEQLKWLIENVDNKLFVMKKAMNVVCLYGRLNIMKWLIENIDNKLFDMKNAMNVACFYGRLDKMKWLIENVDNKLFDMKQAMNYACIQGNLDTVKWLIENIDNELFDMKQAMNNACKIRNLDTVKWLIENIDNELFDMKQAINNACMNGNLDTVKWLIENIDNELFDMKQAMNEACNANEEDMVKWLFKNVDNTSFDIKRVISHACEWGDHDLMKMLIENIAKFDHTCFHLQSLLYTIFDCCNDEESMCYKSSLQEMLLVICKQGQKKEIFWTDVLNKACVFGFLEVVEWLLTNVPSNIFDFDTAIANALSSKSDSIIRFIIERNCHTVTDIRFLTNLLCHHGYTDIALWLLQNNKHSLFDLQTMMNEACLHDDLSLVKYLWEKVNHNLFDMKTAMTKACRGEQSTITIEWLWRNNDQQLFDMNVSMNNACRYGRQNVVEWLWENIDQSNFRLNEAFYNACRNEQYDVVRWMLEKVPRELLDISNALHTACPGNTKDGIVKILLQNINISSINVNLIIREACNHGKTSIIQYLLNMTDVKMIDMNQAMTNILSIDVNSDSYADQDKLLIDEKKQQLATTIIQKTTLSMLKTDELIIEICKNGWLELLQLIWSNKDHSNINIDQSKIDIACEYGRENIVHWAVSNLDPNMINVKALMTQSCSLGWLEIVKKIWTTEENGNFDIKSAMNEGCSYARVEVVTWLIQNADNNLFDMNVVMEISCRNGWIDIIKNILPLDLSTCNATVAITAACTTGSVELVQLLLNQFGKEIIDFDQISKSILTSSKNADLVISLLQNIDFDKFDIRKIFTAACGFGWIDVLKYIKAKASTNCNVSGGMIKACNQGEDKIVTYLLQEFPHYRFDFQSSLLAACTKGWDEIAEILLDTVDHNILHIENNFMNICRSGEADIVSIILKKVDHNLLNLNETINTLSKDKKNEQVVLNIIKNAHKAKWDKQNLIEKAREHSWWKVLVFLNI
ncbi:uncharacterized protein LOC127719334 [Mytilus californianus]|uniref:uncharacterized protein LOC127719334 n=1 Tax=Mytilus californianus TaxID=6549 RepID=UPI002248061A|nr:uncharacterized protein LOC127719334 [Mytilus californianus]